METYHISDDSEASPSFAHFEGILPDEAEFIEQLLSLPGNRYVRSAEVEYDMDTLLLWVRVQGHDQLAESPITIIDRLVTSVIRLRQPKGSYTPAA